jgi:hypothetical protein
MRNGQGQNPYPRDVLRREEKAGSSGKNRPRNDNFFEVQSDGVNDDGLAPEGRPLHGDEGTGVHSQKWLGH